MQSSNNCMFQMTMLFDGTHHGSMNTSQDSLPHKLQVQSFISPDNALAVPISNRIVSSKEAI